VGWGGGVGGGGGVGRGDYGGVHGKRSCGAVLGAIASGKFWGGARRVVEMQVCRNVGTSDSFLCQCEKSTADVVEGMGSCDFLQ